MIGIMTAAGKGTRMKALTQKDLPKVLLEINGKPIISYGIESMIEMGVSKIYIVANNKFENEFNELKKKYKIVDVKYIETNNHIMESVSELSSFVLSDKEYKGENAIYWLADNIFIGETHKDAIRKLDKRIKNGVATTGFLLTETNSPQDFITMNSDGTFSEKPKNPETNLSASGVFLVNKEALSSTEKRMMNVGQNEYTIWDSWMIDHKILSEEILDVWIDVGTPERYMEVKKVLESV